MNLQEQKEAFEAAISAQPNNLLTRQIFADWLEEHGFDDEASEIRIWLQEPVQKAVVWLADYAHKHGMTFEAMISGAHSYLDEGIGSLEGMEFVIAAFDKPHWQDNTQWQQFWQHFAYLTGRIWPGLPTKYEYDEFYDDYGVCDHCEIRYEQLNDPFDDQFYNERGW